MQAWYLWLQPSDLCCADAAWGLLCSGPYIAADTALVSLFTPPVTHIWLIRSCSSASATMRVHALHPWSSLPAGCTVTPHAAGLASHTAYCVAVMCRLSFSVPGVLNLLVLTCTTGSALACYFTCMFTDPGRCGNRAVGAAQQQAVRQWSTVLSRYQRAKITASLSGPQP